MVLTQRAVERAEHVLAELRGAKGEVAQRALGEVARAEGGRVRGEHATLVRGAATRRGPSAVAAAEGE